MDELEDVVVAFSPAVGRGAVAGGGARLAARHRERRIRGLDDDARRLRDRPGGRSAARAAARGSAGATIDRLCDILAIRAAMLSELS